MKLGEAGASPADQPCGQVLMMSDVCRMLGVASGTVYALLKSDPRFPQGAVIGKHRRWLKTDIDAWVVSKCRGEAANG